MDFCYCVLVYTHTFMYKGYIHVLVLFPLELLSGYQNEQAASIHLIDWCGPLVND